MLDNLGHNIRFKDAGVKVEVEIIILGVQEHFLNIGVP
jgi:hypothetical protein